jgi:hypothetical protein
MLVPDPAQQRAIKRAKQLHARGLRLRAIRDDLAKRGHKISHVLVGKIACPGQRLGGKCQVGAGLPRRDHHGRLLEAPVWLRPGT